MGQAKSCYDTAGCVTCGPLDPYDVVAVIQEFDPVLVEMKYLDREHNLVEIPMP